METLPYEIGETGHALRKTFTRRAASLGVTGAQAKVILRLAIRPGMRQVELADLLDIEPITLSRIIDRLEEAGHVERVADPSDRRAWRLQVTAAAQPLIGKIKSVVAEVIDEAFSGIDPKDIEIARQVLAQARENLSRGPQLNRASNA